MAPEIVELQAQPRTLSGKRARHLRRQGFVPGHVYGHGESFDVQIEAKALQEVLRRAGLNTLVSLRVNDTTRSVLVRAVERDNLRRAILNVDLQEVALNEPIKARVPLVLAGEAPAARAGAILLRLVDHLNVEGLPANMPSAIHVDVTHLDEVDQTIHVKDLILPEGLRALHKEEEPVVKVVESRAEAEVPAEAAEAAEAAAPEEAPGPPAEESE